MRHYYGDDLKTLEDRMADKEAQVLAVIRRMIQTSGKAPTLREIVRHTEMQSTSTASAYLYRLKEKGVIDWTPRKRRTLRIIEKGKN